MGEKIITQSESGKEMPKSSHISETRLKLLIRAISRDEFVHKWNERFTRQQLWEHFDVTEHDVDALISYWEMPHRVRPYTYGARANAPSRAQKMDVLAERLYELILPRLTELVQKEVEKALA